MKTQAIFLLLAVFVSSLACQFLLPSRTGTVISECANLVSAVADLQAGDVPEQLFNTGLKDGSELDVNQYFSVLPHLSMQEGYTLDYVYQNDGMAGIHCCMCVRLIKYLMPRHWISLKTQNYQTSAIIWKLKM